VDEWHAPGVERGAALALDGGDRATVLSRRAGDTLEIALEVAAPDGRVVTLLPITRVVVGGVRRREILTGVSPFRAGPETLLRVDVRLFELVAPHFFAVKTALVSLETGHIVLDRLVESGNDVLDRRATIVARGADLVVEERASGQPPRTLTYTRDADGTYVTRDESLFSQ
jgi:hypothetical protein